MEKGPNSHEFTYPSVRELSPLEIALNRANHELLLANLVLMEATARQLAAITLRNQIVREMQA